MFKPGDKVIVTVGAETRKHGYDIVTLENKAYLYHNGEYLSDLWRIKEPSYFYLKESEFLKVSDLTELEKLVWRIE
jgi:hypothetical protein